MTEAELSKAFIFNGPGQVTTPPAAGGMGGFNPLGFLGGLTGTTTPQANTAQLQQQYKDQLALAEKYKQAGDAAGAANAAALAELYRQQIVNQGGTPGGGGIPLLFLIGGGVALWFLLKK